MPIRLLKGDVKNKQVRRAFHNEKFPHFGKNNTNNPAGCPRTGF
jgi:hypothetical protein